MSTRDHLLVLDDLDRAQDRRAGNIGRIQALQPFGGRVLRDIFLPSC